MQAAALALLVGNRALRRLGGRTRATSRTLIVLTAIGLFATATVAVSTGFTLAAVALVVQAVVRGVSAPLQTRWLIRSTDPKARATVLSMYGQADACGQVVGGPLIGLIGRLAGLRIASLALAATMVPTLPLFAQAGAGRATESGSAPSRSSSRP